MPKGKNPTKKAKGTTRAVAGLDPVKTETALSPVSAVEVQDGPGRPTKFKQEFIQQAQALCDLGATDEEMAAFFQVDTRTLYRWKLDNEEFCQAIKAGKSRADDRIERSLFQKASGFYFKEEQAIHCTYAIDKPRGPLIPHHETRIALRRQVFHVVPRAVPRMVLHMAQHHSLYRLPDLRRRHGRKVSGGLAQRRALRVPYLAGRLLIRY